MKIKFLGSGGVYGVPVWNCDCPVCKSKDPKDKRLRPSILVQLGDKNIVVDFGPDFRTQLLRYGVRKLDYVLLTHAHGDHMNDFMQLSKQENLVFEAPKPVLDEFFKRVRSSKKWMVARNASMKVVPFEKKKIEGVSIDTVALEHKKDYLKVNFPCYGYIFSSDKFKMAYLSDYSKIIEVDKLRDMDLIISDGKGFNPQNTGHVGVKGSIDIFKELKPTKMILTHITDEKSHEFLTDYVKKFGNIEIAYDGMEIEL